jgi:hypothetical protein
VQFLDGTANLGTGTLSAGVATLSVSTLASGGHSITAAYPGDASNLASTSAALAQTVKTASSVALISSLNPSTAPQSVTFTATVTPKSATGSVQILDGSTALGTGGLNGGVATLSVSTLTAGAHSITAAYPGDANDTASTSPALAQTVKTASSVALASSVNPSNLQQSVTFTATVTPKTATGSVQFLDGTATLGTGGLNSGVATLGVATLAAGAHSITAAYPGDGTTAPSTSAPVAQTVKAASTVTLTSSAARVTAGQAVVFTARVTPATATGNIQFMDGTTLLGTVALNVDGAATLTNSNLTAGSHSITAVYAGDSKTAGSTSTPLVQTIDAPIQ